MPRRVLGRTGERVSIIGYPGFALSHGDQQEGTDSLHRAFDRGVNYFDVAPAYGNGDAEIKMGVGLQGIDRSKMFLACKTKMRDKNGAREELERSLKRLKTDHFDLYQMHCLIKPEEVDQVFAASGAMETFLKAREEGKVRFLGFSAHTTKAALAAMQRFQFDTVMFPINFIEYFTFAFGKPVLELAERQGVAVLAIKPMSGGDWMGEAKTDREKRHRDWWYSTLEDKRDIDLALRFTLAQKAVVAGIPPAWLDLADRAFEAGQNYRPITEVETEKLAPDGGQVRVCLPTPPGGRTPPPRARTASPRRPARRLPRHVRMRQ